jgi:hypothetical protein
MHYELDTEYVILNALAFKREITIKDLKLFSASIQLSLPGVFFDLSNDSISYASYLQGRMQLPLFAFKEDRVMLSSGTTNDQAAKAAIDYLSIGLPDIIEKLIQEKLRQQLLGSC